MTEGSIHWLGWAVEWEKLWGGSADWHVNQVRMWTRRVFRRQSFTSVHLPLISHAVNEELGGVAEQVSEWPQNGKKGGKGSDPRGMLVCARIVGVKMVGATHRKFKALIEMLSG